MEGSAAPWNIDPAADNQAPGCDLVRQWLREHNWAENPGYMERLQGLDYRSEPLVLLASAGEQMVGGLFAETQLAWLRISIMAVHPGWRSRGIGAALLAAAEHEALRRGCRQVYVDTMEYQAPDFYRAQGFTVAGEIPDWDSHGHRKFYLIKSLI